MVALIYDPDLERRLRDERARTGADRFDEVWDGIYVMAPLADNEHQRIVARLTAIFEETVGWRKLGSVFPGTNVSDRTDDWKSNYRCPDVAVFLNNTKAHDHGAFWLGGPDLAVEIVSAGDRSLEKLEFYASVGTRELLVVHREPWRLEIYRLDAGMMQSTGTHVAGDVAPLRSETVDCTFALIAATPRPTLRVEHSILRKHWDL
jgi:Uma2 family endonuclease